MGFFPESVLIETELPSRIPKCGACKLYKGCRSPKMPFTGKGKRGILIVGEAPGKNEDKENKQFAGKSGKFLDKQLTTFGIDMRKDCWLHNALACRPPDNRTPNDKEIEYCHPNVNNAIEELNPKVIITVGLPAIKSVIKGHFHEKAGKMSRWVGWRIPSRSLNAWICPTYHPSYVQREIEEAEEKRRGTPIKTIFRSHLKQALKLAVSRPYERGNDLAESVQILSDEKEIEKRLLAYVARGGAIAFDYETGMLKPDAHDSRIVSVGVCWKGKETIAFPWSGRRVKRAWRELMRSKNPKIAHNLKFEDRWTVAEGNENRIQQVESGDDPKRRKRTKWKVSNWEWDTMNMAHLLDNRRDICSLGFQAFVRLGVDDYSHATSRFFKQKNSYKPNRIHEVDMDQLLVYNGMDALCTYLLWELQQKDLHVEDWK